MTINHRPLTIVRRTKVGLAVLLAAYCSTGVGLHYQGPAEIFPVFSWFLFTRVPGLHAHFSVLLHEVDGQPVIPPTRYELAEGLLDTPHSMEAQRVIQRLGKAVLHHHPEEVARWRRMLEEDYLPVDTRYELVMFMVRPLQFYKIGRASYQHMGHFSTERGGT